ncbi:glycosyltransferase family 4 protein [Engelhardtia mirabilis]|uniref:GDP-mannose-dependent alpha-(1-6)-phosphatidylinositol monomannoside mannosyltransferase n=1 Tax=Engelhardtia mirabilis TaxID=2528011 RepID=A0A518BJK3_9BACT|nr:GDP-mannose-dependent alpha-(1-6)-phosphatidylinositol monomannoside mannosyltransferase [Planctomycetes bacterium Pla133]QDV01475.1 GDP-mannose-dependent alpha-(1-6)-phosphatidylinositol monomannoside mannosyltransferase [Planctomycetes bacterium Pla86]
MKVAISVLGRFHAFDLARELDAQGVLERLITSYPRQLGPRFGVDPWRIKGLPAIEAVHRLWQRLPVARRDALEPTIHALYERAVPRHLPREMDVFVGWSGVSLAGIRAAKRRGALTVLERGSAHIEEQTRLLRAEYGRFGIEPRTAHPAVIDKELAEYEAADAIAVPSGFARDSFVERGIPASKLIVNPYGVSIDSFTPAAVGPGRLRLLAVGRVSIQKGSHLLLEAFAKFERKDAELHFVGPIEPEIEPFRERLADDRVHFHGAVPQSELPQAYRLASAFCLPSIQEGMAMVTIQAMASGLPCLVTPNTGAAGLVRDGVEGFMVPAGDAESLRDGIERLAADEARAAQMGAAAALRVRDGFSWSDYGLRAAAAYRALLDGRCAPDSPLEIHTALAS